jgi:hypothetical protein
MPHKFIWISRSGIPWIAIICRRQTYRLSAGSANSFHILLGKDNYRLEREQRLLFNSQKRSTTADVKKNCVREMETAEMCLTLRQSPCLLRPAFLLSLIFEPEDGGDMFLRNVRWLSAYYTCVVSQEIFMDITKRIADPLLLSNEYMYYYVF